MCSMCVYNLLVRERAHTHTHGRKNQYFHSNIGFIFYRLEETVSLSSITNRPPSTTLSQSVSSQGWWKRVKIWDIWSHWRVSIVNKCVCSSTFCLSTSNFHRPYCPNKLSTLKRLIKSVCVCVCVSHYLSCVIGALGPQSLL